MYLPLQIWTIYICVYIHHSITMHCEENWMQKSKLIAVYATTTGYLYCNADDNDLILFS